MKSFTYDAFISYRHISHDKAIAEKLQKLLEAYKPPKSNIYTHTSRIRKIFRDESELPTSCDLDMDIRKALEQSAFLIVICSEETSKSQWCLQEISYFKSLHNGENDNILTLLVSGNPRDVFPKELCYENRRVCLPDGSEAIVAKEVEPLASNVTAQTTKASLKKLKTEFLRIAAPILGCSFDDLYRRHQKRLVRNIILSTAAIVAVLLSFSGFSYSQVLKINRQAQQIMSQKTEIQNAYNDLEKTNEELNQTNNRLSDQINETERQKNIAEENRKEAEEQAEFALNNLELANEQKALAVQNENRAVSNLNYAKEQQLFRTVDYAKELALSGDRIQAGAILSEAYDRFDKNSKNYTSFMDRIGTAMANTAYYPGYSVYMKFESAGPVSSAAVSDDDKLFASASGNRIIIRNTANGNVRTKFECKTDVTAIFMKNQYLLAGCEGGVLNVWDMNTRKMILDVTIEARFVFGTNRIIKITCNDKINAIVLEYGDNVDFPDGVAFIPYPWYGKESSGKIQTISYFEAQLSDNGRFLLLPEDKHLTVLNLDSFSFNKTPNDNRKDMVVFDLASSDLLDKNQQINNEGLVYYITRDSANYGFCSNIYDTSNKVLLKQYKSLLTTEFLKNDFDGSMAALGGNNISLMNLNDAKPIDTAININKEHDHWGYCQISYIPGSDCLIYWDKLYKDEVYVLDMKGERMTQLKGLGGPTALLTISPSGNIIMMVSKEGAITLQSRDGYYPYIKDLGQQGFYTSTQYITNTGYLVHMVTENDSRIPVVFNTKTNQRISVLSYSSGEYTTVSGYGISPDDTLLLGTEETPHSVAIRIWDIHTGEIINKLDTINELQPTTVTDTFGVSQNFKYIAASIDRVIYVYSIEKNEILYTYKIDDFIDFVGVENDGCTLWYIDKNGTVRIINLRNNNVLLNKKINFEGNSILGAALNINENRIIFNYTRFWAEQNEYHLDVYSLITGEKLMGLQEMIPDSSNWVLSPDIHSAYTYDYSNKRSYSLAVPGFITILRDIRLMAKDRILTPEERQLSGLNIFDLNK